MMNGRCDVWQWVYHCPTCRRQMGADRVDVLEDVGPMRECQTGEFESVDLVGYRRVEPVVGGSSRREPEDAA